MGFILFNLFWKKCTTYFHMSEYLSVQWFSMENSYSQRNLGHIIHIVWTLWTHCWSHLPYPLPLWLLTCNPSPAPLPIPHVSLQQPCEVAAWLGPALRAEGLESEKRILCRIISRIQFRSGSAIIIGLGPRPFLHRLAVVTPLSQMSLHDSHLGHDPQIEEH